MRVIVWLEGVAAPAPSRVPPYAGEPFKRTAGVPGTSRSPDTNAPPLRVALSGSSTSTDPSRRPLIDGAWRTTTVLVTASVPEADPS